MEQTTTTTTNPQAKNCKYTRVILLDDNQLDNMVNSKIIESNRFAAQITAFEKGSIVLNYLRNEDFNQLPDIIFLDIMMPEMDGFQFLDEFEKLPPEIHSRVKVIMLSTSESFKDLNRANKNRFVYKFLNKPLTEEVLSAINI